MDEGLPAGPARRERTGTGLAHGCASSTGEATGDPLRPPPPPPPPALRSRSRDSRSLDSRFRRGRHRGWGWGRGDSSSHAGRALNHSSVRARGRDVPAGGGVMQAPPRPGSGMGWWLEIPDGSIQRPDEGRPDQERTPR